MPKKIDGQVIKKTKQEINFPKRKQMLKSRKTGIAVYIQQTQIYSTRQRTAKMYVKKKKQ
jgi:hypothetical protein